jgi:hypothetical protein
MPVRINQIANKSIPALRVILTAMLSPPAAIVTALPPHTAISLSSRPPFTTTKRTLSAAVCAIMSVSSGHVDASSCDRPRASQR